MSFKPIHNSSFGSKQEEKQGIYAMFSFIDQEVMKGGGPLLYQQQLYNPGGVTIIKDHPLECQSDLHTVEISATFRLVNFCLIV